MEKEASSWQGWMSDSEYQLVTNRTPIPCIDLVILRQNASITETLMMRRRTGYERGSWCIIGGGQRIGERAEDTIQRQASELGVSVYPIPPFTPGFPAWVNDNPFQDKTKHPITMVYPVAIIGGKLLPEGEEFYDPTWFSVENLPSGIAYDHQEEILTTITQLRKMVCCIRQLRDSK